MCRQNAMMASSITTAYHLLPVTLLLSTIIICLVIHRTVCFSPQRTWWSKKSSRHWRNNPCNNNLHPSHRHHSPSLDCRFTTTATTALSLSILEESTADHHQWNYHESYNTDDEIIHGRYTAVITSTTDLTNRWIGSFHPSASSLNTTTANDIPPPPPPLEALQAIQATHRWADKFVRQLNLCPW